MKRYWWPHIRCSINSHIDPVSGIEWPSPATPTHTQTPLSLFRMWTIEQLLNQLSIIRIDPLQALPCTQYTGKESTHKTRHGNLIISCYFLIECWWVVFAYWDILALYLTNIGCRMQIMRLILSMSDDRILDDSIYTYTDIVSTKSESPLCVT